MVYDAMMLPTPITFQNQRHSYYSIQVLGRLFEAQHMMLVIDRPRLEPAEEALAQEQ